MPEYVLTGEAFITLDEEENPVYNLIGDGEQTPEIHGIIEMIKCAIVSDTDTVTITLTAPHSEALLFVEEQPTGTKTIFPTRLTTDYAGNNDNTAGDVSRTPVFVIGRLTISIDPLEVVPEEPTWIGTVEVRIWVREV